MKTIVQIQRLLAVLAVCVLLIACSPSMNQAAIPTSPTTLETEGDLETQGVVNSADGKLRVSGRGPFLLSLRQMSNPPTAPSGWELVGPVFDITARDRQQRPVRQFAAPLLLRFDIASNRPATILVHAENGWQIVPSEFDADGKLSASVDHLTPYTVGVPALTSSSAPAVGTRAATLSPGARVTVTRATVTPADAEGVLSTAVEQLKQKKAKISAAAGYSGSLYVAVPPALQNVLGTAIGAGGACYYGLYGAVNEVIVVQAAGSGASGTLTLLVEPKTTMPTSAADAKTQLTTLFPGVTVPLTQAQQAQTAYVFYGVSGNTAYSLGYVSYNGVALAYAVVGSGSYTGLVPK